MIVYSIGTTIASFSTSLTMLIIGWSILEGLGAALMIPNIQVLLRGKYDGADRAFSYGIISSVAAVGAALGPIVGGFFTTFISWRWAFRTELVIAVVVLIMARTLQADREPERRPKFDFVGALLSIFGWSSIVLGILLAQKYGFFLAKEPFVLGPLEIAPFGLSITPILVGLGVLLVILLFRWEGNLERAGKDALFRPSLLGISGIKPGMAIRFLQTGITAAFLYVLPLLLQLSFEFTAMQTGLALMPFSLMLLILAIIGARHSARFYANRIIQVGFVLAAAGLGVMATSIQPAASFQDLALGGLFGAGIGLIASQILNLILSGVSEEQTPETAGLTSTFEQLGNAIGVALIGTIMMVTLSTNLQQGFTASSVIPEEIKGPLIESAEESVQLMSSSALEQGLADAGVAPEVAEEIEDIYGLSRTQAFKAGVGFLVFASLLGLVVSLWLPKRKLVDVEDAPAEEAAAGKT